MEKNEISISGLPTYETVIINKNNKHLLNEFYENNNNNCNNDKVGKKNGFNKDLIKDSEIIQETIEDDENDTKFNHIKDTFDLLEKNKNETTNNINDSNNNNQNLPNKISNNNIYNNYHNKENDCCCNIF